MARHCGMRCVFVGTDGFLARFDGTTAAAFWPADSRTHGFDPALLVELDLARTPSAAVFLAAPSSDFLGG